MIGVDDSFVGWEVNEEKSRMLVERNSGLEHVAVIAATLFCASVTHPSSIICFVTQINYFVDQEHEVPLTRTGHGIFQMSSSRGANLRMAGSPPSPQVVLR